MAERNLEIFPMRVIFHWRSSSIEGCPPSKVVFHQKLSSITNVFSHRRLSSLKFVFHRRSSLIIGRPPSLVVFHRRSPSIKGRLPSKVNLHRRSSSIEGRDCQNFKVIGPEGMPILVLGRRKRLQLKWHRPKTYKSCCCCNWCFFCFSKFRLKLVRLD